MKDIEKLQIAIEKNEIFEFLIGKGDYQIRLSVAEMPTDTSSVSWTIGEYIKLNPNFDKTKFYKAFYKLRKSEWAWLIVYYMVDIELGFIPFRDLLSNLNEMKSVLSQKTDWVCHNFGDRCPNLWSIVMYHLSEMKKDGLYLPDFSNW